MWQQNDEQSLKLDTTDSRKSRVVHYLILLLYSHTWYIQMLLSLQRFLLSFSNRVINIWNSLPDTFVSSATVTGFKLKLKSLNFLLDWCSYCKSVVQSGGGASVRAGPLPWCPMQSTHFSSYCVFMRIAGCFSFIVCLFILCCQIYLIWFIWFDLIWFYYYYHHHHHHHHP